MLIIYIPGWSGLKLSSICFRIVAAERFGRPLAIMRRLSTSSIGSSYKGSTAFRKLPVTGTKLKEISMLLVINGKGYIGWLYR